MRRVDYYLWALKHPLPALEKLVRKQRLRLKGLKMGVGVDVRMPIWLGYPKNVSIGERTTVCECAFLMAGPNSRIEIGNDCLIAPNVYITTTAHKFSNRDRLISEQGGTERGVVISNDVLIGTKVVVLPGVVVGSGAVIGAGSVVGKNVKPYMVVAGVPAKELGRRGK